jgi:hypothetical protein
MNIPGVVKAFVRTAIAKDQLDGALWLKDDAAHVAIASSEADKARGLERWLPHVRT